MIQFYFSLFTFAHIHPITKRIVAMENDIDRDITFTTKGPNIIAFAINDWPPLRIWARAVFTIKSRAKRMQKIAEAVKRPFLFLLSFFILILLKKISNILDFYSCTICNAIMDFSLISPVFLVNSADSVPVKFEKSAANAFNNPMPITVSPEI